MRNSNSMHRHVNRLQFESLETRRLLAVILPGIQPANAESLTFSIDWGAVSSFRTVSTAEAISLLTGSPTSESPSPDVAFAFAQVNPGSSLDIAGNRGIPLSPDTFIDFTDVTPFDGSVGVEVPGERFTLNPIANDFVPNPVEPDAPFSSELEPLGRNAGAQNLDALPVTIRPNRTVPVDSTTNLSVSTLPTASPPFSILSPSVTEAPSHTLPRNDVSTASLDIATNKSLAIESLTSTGATDLAASTSDPGSLDSNVAMSASAISSSFRVEPIMARHHQIELTDQTAKVVEHEATQNASEASKAAVATPPSDRVARVATASLIDQLLA